MEEYDVIFLDDDKTTVLDIQKVSHGEKAVYKGKTQTNNNIHHFFLLWDSVSFFHIGIIS